MKPGWMGGRWGRNGQKAATAALLLLLLLYSILFLAHGLHASREHPSADLMARAREFAVFREGLYPMRPLAPQPQPASFPYSVYPPYALILFGAFFAWGGTAQAWAMVHGLSLLSLALIGWYGWRSLRFAGPAAGLLGAMAPAAISGNGNGLFHGQFSLLCMGLICLQWLCLDRRRPLAAGLCWAAAMLKPQIALAFALPLLRRGSRRGLVLGLILLLLLSAAAFLHTGVDPLRFLVVWLQPGRFRFVESGNLNLLALLGQVRPATTVLLSLALAGLLAVAALLGRQAIASRSCQPRAQRAEITAQRRTLAPDLREQGLCALLGSLVLYHYNYDNIMLFPALLAILARALEQRGLWSQLLAVAMAITLWMPVHLNANSAALHTLNAGVWLLVALTLLGHPGPARPPWLALDRFPPTD